MDGRNFVTSFDNQSINLKGSASNKQDPSWMTNLTEALNNVVIQDFSYRRNDKQIGAALAFVNQEETCHLICRKVLNCRREWMAKTLSLASIINQLT
jgi:preprotein translocase subunit Sec63